MAERLSEEQLRDAIEIVQDRIDVYGYDGQQSESLKKPLLEMLYDAEKAPLQWIKLGMQITAGEVKLEDVLKALENPTLRTMEIERAVMNPDYGMIRYTLLERRKRKEIRGENK